MEAEANITIEAVKQELAELLKMTDIEFTEFDDAGYAEEEEDVEEDVEEE